MGRIPQLVQHAPAPVGIRPRGSAAPWYLAAGVAPIIAYQAKGAGSLAASYINLINPGTYDATTASAPTLVANGWSFDGVSNCLDTGYNPIVNTSTFIQYTGWTIQNAIFGAFAGGPAGYLLQRVLAVMRVWSGDNSADNAGILSDGNYGLSGKTPYRNGVAETAVVSADAYPAFPMHIGCLNSAGVPANFSSIVVARFIVFNITLNATQSANIAAAMAA